MCVTGLCVSSQEAVTVGWLCDEFVRRLAKSKATRGQTPPRSQDIVLTRASDGAELFSEDLISDVVADNERVSNEEPLFVRCVDGTIPELDISVSRSPRLHCVHSYYY